MGRPYEQISKMEREYIALERRKGTSWAALGRQMGRPASAAWREVRRNRRADGFYHVRRAHRLALKRRSQARRVRKLADAEVCRRVEERLRIGWTPALIAREVTTAGSPRTIYREIRGPRAERWGPLLPGVPKRERLRKQRRERIHGRVMIDARPALVETRSRIGDWEGDTIRPAAGSEVGLLTLVERKTRLVRMALLADRSAATLNATAARLLQGFVIHTLTVDNGMEFASHKELSARIGAVIYFAHEHSPWERGANEQVNKLIRYFMPRRIDMAGYRDADVSHFELLLNERPRKCLNYLSPEQSMHQASLHLK
jgi:IS30 family transposase